MCWDSSVKRLPGQDIHQPDGRVTTFLTASRARLRHASSPAPATSVQGAASRSRVRIALGRLTMPATLDRIDKHYRMHDTAGGFLGWFAGRRAGQALCTPRQ